MADDGTTQARENSHPAGWRGLATLLEQHRGQRHLIVLQEYPDPDAISSAMAHRWISRRFDIESDIVYGGQISHQENRALVKLTGLDLIRYRDGIDIGAYDGAVFLDNQGTTAGEIVAALQQARVPILAVIDHHEPQGVLQPQLKDIRRIGATASMYASYLREGLLELDPEEPEDVKVTTALMHGIMSDTGDFLRATEADFEGAAFLSRYRDIGLLEQIMSQSRTEQTMRILQRALESRQLVNGNAIVGVGTFDARDRDAIPQAADLLLTESQVHTAIAFGILLREEGEPLMVGSLRTSKLTMNPDDFIKSVFGRADDGSYFGGGKPSAGAFELPLRYVDAELGQGNPATTWPVYERAVKDRLVAKLAAADDEGRPD
ncbi:MAG TPA: bifunctional oligoribonuclease/PAP phosphatase NrnA [Anaerolineales bacterium]|jgi:nanoRNase/pAp phosphatase (c-di-AMP/oligoRNAs hydrolase)